MKSFILKLLIFCSGFVIMERVVLYFMPSIRPLDYKLFVECKTVFYKKHLDVDILIFGDSQIADAMDTRILENNCGKKSYNMAIYDTSPFEQFYIIQSAINHLRKKPEIVILGTNPRMFDMDMTKGTYTSVILRNDPVMNYKFCIHSEEGLDQSFFFGSLNETFLFNDWFRRKIKGRKYMPLREVVSVYNGHLEFYNQHDVEWEVFEDIEGGEFFDEQVRYFIKTIEFLKSHNIEIIIVNPPIWPPEVEFLSNTERYRRFQANLEKISDDYLISVYNPDFIFNEVDLEHRDYLNTTHLNYYGCSKYTNHFSGYLEGKIAKN
ncbi:MAG: hypothetical protein ACFCUM_06245 [Bacteroidales bacterium]